MILRTACLILLRSRRTFAASVLAVAASTFLVVFQVGIFFGFQHDTTVMLDAFQADLWIVPRGQPSFDGYVAIDDQAANRALNCPGVQSAERIVWAYTKYRLPESGAVDAVQLLGIESESAVPIRLQVTADGTMRNLDDVRDRLRPAGAILVGRKSMRQLGVDGKGVFGMEINERHAVLIGFVEDVHLFSTYGLVVTDLENAQAFLDLPERRVSYVACQVRNGQPVDKVREQLQKRLPEHEVLTTGEFRDRTYRYWQTKTGVGPILLFPCGLAALAGIVVVASTFHITTVQRLPLMAALKAMGASNGEMMFMLLLQALAVAMFGTALALGGVAIAVGALATTNNTVVVTQDLLVGTSLGVVTGSVVCILLPALRVLRTPPMQALRCHE